MIRPCYRCGNQDVNLVSLINGKTYCRRCIEFNKPVKKISKSIFPKKINPKISFKLSKNQIKLSNIINNSKKDIYVSAVTGSGKTEVTLKAISQAIAKGQRVGFIIPRKAIVIEIAARLRNIFPTLKISEVYHGSKYDYDGDLIVLTAHQSYRYTNKFGLIIVDEYDAFPLVDNPVLKDIVNRTCYGKRIFLSATFEADELVGKSVGYLNSRYHNFKLPEPVFIRVNSFSQLFKIIKIIKENKAEKFIFYFPTIKILQSYYYFLKISGIKVNVVHSRIESINQKIKEYISNQSFAIFSTIILERGVTIPNVNVVVINANHQLYSKANLIQIAGRVGRSKYFPRGEVIFFGSKKTPTINQAIAHIKAINDKLYYLPR